MNKENIRKGKKCLLIALLSVVAFFCLSFFVAIISCFWSSFYCFGKSLTGFVYPIIAIVITISIQAAVFFFITGLCGSEFVKDKKNIKDAIRCTNCGYKGPGKKFVKGSLAMEIAFWLFFLIAGVVCLGTRTLIGILFILPGMGYSVWRLTSKYFGCPKCRWQYVVRQECDPMRKQSDGEQTSY